MNQLDRINQRLAEMDERDRNARKQAFNEWWIAFRGFDDPSGKEGMQDCWNAALDAAVVEMEACSTYDEYDPASGFVKILRQLKSPE